MFRIAVIQNEVEMQHSGYVDSVPKYKTQNFELKEHVFNRFSSVNIRDLFIEGENYLLDYDCLIIGTNATSDGDVYKTLCEERNKHLLELFISLGKGLLICSQKKFNKVEEKDTLYNVRKTYFLPDSYEYQVISRPKSENSSDGSVVILDDNQNKIQEFICNYPRSISDEKIEDSCNKNDFQKHYYRDFISPIYDSSYFPILVDYRESVRNTLMVACPRKNEKIVISTMALDWAGHYELIENILYYLIIGIPSVAFVNKSNENDIDFDFLVSEADLYRISYKLYNSLDDCLNGKLKKYHTLFVFSPNYTEEEVASFWEQNVKKQNDYIKLFYYKHINKELVLVNFSYYSYIDTQKHEVETWLKSKFDGGFWDNSFWKTFDALFALHNMDISINSYLKSIFQKIHNHYKNGSYDGVLAPTCGLLELESLIKNDDRYKYEIKEIEKYYTETKEWLIDKYKSTSNYNKKFIIRSFFNSGCLDDLEQESSDFKDELQRIALDDANSDKLEVDLCLDIDVCIICINAFGNKKDIENRIKTCTSSIIKNQMQNGRWDNNLGKTARLLVFLLKNKQNSEFVRINSDLDNSVNRGIIALRNAYNENNWENNIVTTANAITAIVSYDKTAPYKSKDFLNQVNKEAKLADSYNSLLLALSTIDKITKKYGESSSELTKLRDAESKLHSCQNNLNVSISVSIVSFLLIISYYIFLAIKDFALFTSMLMESLMWIPIVVGIAITGLVGFIPKFITKKKPKRKD